MNKYDSEKLEGILSAQGMEPAGSPDKADIILVNSCSIREKAESKVFSLLGRLANVGNGRKPVIALGGCIPTLRGKEIFRSAPAVDLLYGPDSLEKLPAMLKEYFATGKKQVDLEFSDSTAWDGPDPCVRPSDVTAWVGIMKGCDNHCSYCVVPDTRGPEVSRPVESILAEVSALAEKGYREINLLGQNVNSYGKTVPRSVTFPELLGMVEEIEGVERIRFMTSHPKDLTDRLIERMAGSKKICPSLHLPLQAGSDRILAMMNRGYTAGGYLQKIRKLKSAVPGIAISTDLMVGFPMETDDDFEDTIRMMEEVRFDSLYLFIYSRRPATPAAEFDGQVSRDVAHSRFEKALALHRKTVSRKLADREGSIVEVLCEGEYGVESTEGTGAPPIALFGRSADGHKVIFEAEKNLKGEILSVRVTRSAGFNLYGKPVAERNANGRRNKN